MAIVNLKTVDDAIKAIKEMYVRGAPLIGVTGAYAVYLATLNAPNGQIDTEYLQHEARRIKSARPTAVNLAWALDRIMKKVSGFSGSPDDLRQTLLEEAQRIADEDVEINKRMAEHGAALIEDGDTVWLDADASGTPTQDAGEPGIDGVTVELYDACMGGNLIATTTTSGGAGSGSGCS